MEGLLRDFRYALRVQRKTASFSAIAILTLALGIGASAAVFSVIDAILLKPLPYKDAARIVMPWRIAPIAAAFDNGQFPWSKRDFLLFSQETKAFEYVGAFQGDSFNLTGAGDPIRLDGIRASAGFFPSLGVTPDLGRTFTKEEDRPGQEYEVVLSHRLWRDRFGGDPGAVGRQMELNGYSYTIVGVMPPGFVFPRAEEMPASLDFPREAQLWVPLAIPPAPHGPEDLAVIGRLRPDISIQQSQAELDVFAKRLESLRPEAKGWYNCRVVPLSRQIAGDTRRPLLLIFGAVGVVLLIACSNVASLLLTRSIRRRTELVVRAALGAGNTRIVRQLLTESVVLALAGALVGIVLAFGGVYLVKAFGPANIPRLQEASVDLPVFGFAAAIALVTGLLFGWAPAFSAARENLATVLREGGQRGGGSLSGSRMRNGLLVLEVALALLLTIAAGLLVRSFYRILGADGGFNPEHVLTFELSLPSSKYPDPDHMVRLYRDILLRLEDLPGVSSAGLVSAVPMGGAPDSSVIRIPEHPATNDKERAYANYLFASRGYFEAVGTPLLRGREFLESDTLASTPVTVINSSMAKKFWPGEDPLGKQVGVFNPRWPARTIVGIVADIKHISLREDASPEMYVPYTQDEIKVWPSMQTMQMAVRTKVDPNSMTGSVRESIRAVDPGLPMARVVALTRLVDDSMTQPRFAMVLLGSFAGLAVVLACIGMYGVISYGVAQRTREIGIRMAIGAQRQDVFRMVIWQGVRLAGAGIAIGLLGALALTRLMTSFLYGVRPTDPLTFATVSLMLAAVALAACYVPARRATRVDPMISLRYE
ncbi:MAG TPA: ABC transporter permease [Bryobacteraceae bacterium]|jgi:putative ABC transport system permease protein|nr:ABC transporter permease [Bryobacteraceae bacterium]